MSTQDFRYCPECDQRIPVTTEWKLFTHFAGTERCPGSQQAIAQPEAARNRHGSRWR